MDVSLYSGFGRKLRSVSRALPFVSLMAIAVSANPPAQADVLQPGVQAQIRIGDRAAAELIKQYPVVTDNRSHRLARVGERLVEALPVQDRCWHWNFTLLDSLETNSLAFPGGHICVFTGLYDRLSSDDELAALLSHQMAHIRLQHWAHEYAADQTRHFGLKLALEATHTNALLETVASGGDPVLDLGFSRREEEAADSTGMTDMVAAGFDPGGVLDLFAVVRRHQDPEFEFVNDHPISRERYQLAMEAVQRLGAPDRKIALATK